MILSNSRKACVLFVLLFSDSACGSNSGHAADQPPPNIVLIMADDLGYGDISCYGGWIKTPHLDALAAGGLRFTDYHSSGAVCSPTRAGLMTGLYQQRVGIPGVVTVKNHRDKGLTTNHLTFAELAKQAGYTTAMFGKWHLGYRTKFNPVHHGFDQFRGYVSGNVDYFSHVDQGGVYDWWNGTKQFKDEGYVTHLITKYAVDFIEKNQQRPFCLYLAHEAPHYPYQGPNDKPDRTVGDKFDTHGSRTDKQEAYREMVDEMDKSIGEVITTLERLKLRQRTFVFFCSDNGATSLGSNGKLRGFKGSVWEGGHRVPAIANWPDTIPAGKVTHQPAICLDVLPTIAAITGAKIPANHKLDGMNLLPVLKGSTRVADRTLFWRHGRKKTIRRGAWKLVISPKTRKSKKVLPPALFNLRTDVSEKNDLAAEHPERVKQLESELRAWEEEVGEDRFGS